VNELISSFENNVTLQTFELETFISAATKESFLSHLKKLTIPNLMHFAMDIISVTANGTTFNGFAKGNRIELPILFVDFIVEYFKKMDFKFHMQMLEIRFKSLENIYFAIFDFILCQRLIWKKDQKEVLIFPANLKLLSGIEKIKNKPMIINNDHMNELLFIKKGKTPETERIYLNQPVWQKIKTKTQNHQYWS